MSKVKIRFWNKNTERYIDSMTTRYYVNEDGNVMSLSHSGGGRWSQDGRDNSHIEPHYFYPDPMPEIIVCAAMQVIWTNVSGVKQRHVFTNVRHHAIFLDPYYMYLKNVYGLENLQRTEGFVSNKLDEDSETNQYRFYDREDANELFDNSGQLRRADGGHNPSEGTLFSEGYC